mmetsp:Transcript_72407/g.223697  ORF Transcript_72407/g.223697 Transcript_72407/m.223697 type:complete len:475 (+) Transcript_72407:1711-3135(+)
MRAGVRAASSRHDRPVPDLAAHAEGRDRRLRRLAAGVRGAARPGPRYRRGRQGASGGRLHPQEPRGGRRVHAGGRPRDPAAQQDAAAVGRSGRPLAAAHCRGVPDDRPRQPPGLPLPRQRLLPGVRGRLRLPRGGDSGRGLRGGAPALLRALCARGHHRQAPGALQRAPPHGRRGHAGVSVLHPRVGPPDPALRHVPGRRPGRGLQQRLCLRLARPEAARHAGRRAALLRRGLRLGAARGHPRRRREQEASEGLQDGEAPRLRRERQRGRRGEKASRGRRRAGLRRSGGPVRAQAQTHARARGQLGRAPAHRRGALGRGLRGDRQRGPRRPRGTLPPGRGSGLGHTHRGAAKGDSRRVARGRQEAGRRGVRPPSAGPGDERLRGEGVRRRARGGGRADPGHAPRAAEPRGEGARAGLAQAANARRAGRHAHRGRHRRRAQRLPAPGRGRQPWQRAGAPQAHQVRPGRQRLHVHL